MWRGLVKSYFVVKKCDEGKLGKLQKCLRPNTSVTAREKKDISQRIMLLENRLDGVMISFNGTLAQNSNIRNEIDHLVGPSLMMQQN